MNVKCYRKTMESTQRKAALRAALAWTVSLRKIQIITETVPIDLLVKEKNSLANVLKEMKEISKEAEKKRSTAR